jgi:hypothetical protein
MMTTPRAVSTPPAEDAEVLAEFLPVSSQIAHFLAGNTTGSALFHALYDYVLDEPIPPQLTDLLRR